jgi:tetratricopeptide (TPR) repeat protein
MGDYEKALPLYQRALEIREKLLGPQHPDVATTLNNLAELYYHTERYEEALSLLERSLKIFESKLGPANQNFKTTEQNIQVLRAKMGEK